MKRDQQATTLTKTPARRRRLTTVFFTVLAGAGLIAYVARLRR